MTNTEWELPIRELTMLRTLGSFSKANHCTGQSVCPRKNQRSPSFGRDVVQRSQGTLPYPILLTLLWFMNFFLLFVLRLVRPSAGAQSGPNLVGMAQGRHSIRFGCRYRPDPARPNPQGGLRRHWQQRQQQQQQQHERCAAAARCASAPSARKGARKAPVPWGRPSRRRHHRRCCPWPLRLRKRVDRARVREGVRAWWRWVRRVGARSPRARPRSSPGRLPAAKRPAAIVSPPSQPPPSPPTSPF